jgi:hypothetical protein
MAGVHGHSFVMPGLAFALIIGKSIPEELRRLCFVRGAGNPILVTDAFEDRLYQEILATLQVYKSKRTPQP